MDCPEPERGHESQAKHAAQPKRRFHREGQGAAETGNQPDYEKRTLGQGNDGQAPSRGPAFVRVAFHLNSQSYSAGPQSHAGGT